MRFPGKILMLLADLLDAVDQWSSKILSSFQYSSWAKLTESLAPSLKYTNITNLTVIVSGLSASVLRIFGLDGLAFTVLMMVFVFELATGLMKATVSKEEITSARLSRFLFKVSYYLILIAISYLMSESFLARGKETASMIFDWMHLFFVVQIVLENVVSIAENLAVINGKEKSHWITALQEKVNNWFK
jgi:phage-related holin